MHETTKVLIEECKTGNEKAVERMLEKFQPLIHKYARYFGENEKEDIAQELRIALYEAVIKIENVENEVAATNYIVRSIKHRFGQLYKKQLQIRDMEDAFLEDFDVGYDELSYENSVFYVDLVDKLKQCSKKQRFIIYEILNHDASDGEIAERLGVSKQYVNRIKKKIF